MSRLLHYIKPNIYSYRVWMGGTTANVLGLLLMTSDHFIAVRFSLKHKLFLRKRVVFSLIAVSWVISILHGMLQTMIIESKGRSIYETVKQQELKMIGHCALSTIYYDFGFDFGQVHDNVLISYSDIAFLSGILLTMIVVYSYIAHVVFKVSKQRQLRLQTSSSISSKTINSQRRRSTTKGLCTTALLVGAFIILWAPIYIYRILQISESSVLKGADIVAVEIALVVTASTTSIVDILIYFMRSPELSKLIKEVKPACCLGESPPPSLQMSSKQTLSTSADH